MNEEVKRAKHKNKEEMTAEDFVCRAVITLADASRHAVSIYQVCNFKYYGVTSPKVDFYREDGLKNPRGGPSQWHGAYLLRTHKHRYAYILDDTLKCCYQEMPKPSANALIEKTCCGGTHILYDNRFKEYWTCPICTGKLELVDKDGNKLENPRLQGVTVKEKDKENDNFTKFSWDL